jgi:hypothetical protein
MLSVNGTKNLKTRDLPVLLTDSSACLLAQYLRLHSMPVKQKNGSLLLKEYDLVVTITMAMPTILRNVYVVCH